MTGLRVGLLECDHIGTPYRSIAGDVGDMFAALLPSVDLVPYDVWGGVVPSSPESCDAWLCTGSRASVYDDLPWIPPLLDFVRSVAAAELPFFGVCFGHQVLGQALGGRVERAPGGWGVGAHRISVVGGGAEAEPWMDPPLAAPNLLFMHQDQITLVPPGGEVLGSADHCPVAMLRVGPSMVGIQAHPEFNTTFVAALLDDRTERIGDERAAAARASLTAAPTDEVVVGRWMLNVLSSSSVESAPPP